MEYKNILEFAKKILSIPSPSGYTKEVINFLASYCKEKNYDYSFINNGNLEIDVKGESEYTICISGHVDTLGGMVSAILSNGTLKFDVVGGPILPTYDGEYCKVITRNGKVR